MAVRQPGEYIAAFAPPPTTRGSGSANPSMVDVRRGTMSQAAFAPRTGQRDAPGGADLLSAIAIADSTPVDDRVTPNRRIDGRSVLQVTADVSIDSGTVFTLGGTLAAAHVFSDLRIAVERFEGGTFVGITFEPFRSALVSRNSFYASGGDTLTPVGLRLPIVGIFNTNGSQTYRIWVDLVTSVGGAGFGLFGVGSGATARVGVLLNAVDFQFFG